MEMNMAKFSEKLVELLELAKKKKNVLEYQLPNCVPLISSSRFPSQ